MVVGTESFGLTASAVDDGLTIVGIDAVVSGLEPVGAGLPLA